MGGPDDVDLNSFPEPGDRYAIKEEFGQGAFGRVFAAQDGEASGKRVAIKVQKQEKAIVEFIKQEYIVLRDLCQHPNLIEFYGIFRCKQKKEIWFVLEVCIYFIESILFELKAKILWQTQTSRFADEKPLTYRCRSHGVDFRFSVRLQPGFSGKSSGPDSASSTDRFGHTLSP